MVSLKEASMHTIMSINHGIVLMIGMHYCLVCKNKYSTTNKLVVRMTANLFKWMFQRPSGSIFHLDSTSGTRWSQRWSSSMILSYGVQTTCKQFGWTSTKKKIIQDQLMIIARAITKAAIELNKYMLLVSEQCVLLSVSSSLSGVFRVSEQFGSQ